MQEKLETLKVQHNSLVDNVLKVKNKEIEILTQRDKNQKDISTDKFQEQQLIAKAQNLEADLLDLQNRQEKLTVQLNSMTVEPTPISQKNQSQLKREQIQKIQEELTKLERSQTQKQLDIEDLKRIELFLMNE